MRANIIDVTAPADTWEQAYAHIEYLRTGLQVPFSSRIDVVHFQKLCTCEVEEMWPLSAYPATDFPYTCKRCQGAMTKQQNDEHNQYLGGHGWDDDDDREDMWPEV